MRWVVAISTGLVCYALSAIAGNEYAIGFALGLIWEGALGLLQLRQALKNAKASFET
jgi:hypothetical protein